MAVADVPFDLAEVKLPVPSARPGTVAKADVIARLCTSNVALALAAGATTDQIVASLEAVTPVTGTARVVQCAPKLALALGYDVDAALERRDP